MGGGLARWSSLCCVLVTVGCGAGLPDAPVVPDPNLFPPPESVVPEGLGEDPPRPFTLMPGDVLMLQTVSTETATYEGLVVDEVGVLHVPLAGDVEVGGLGLEQAEQRVQEALRLFDTVVVANLFVTDPAGHRATVLGAVEEPGRIQLAPGTRLADLVAAAGGPMMDVDGAESVVYANLHGARLVREGQTLPVSVALAMQGEPRHNVLVRPGDVLYVPPTMGTRITVLGAVAEPRLVPYRDGILLTEALAMASGVTIDGDDADIRIVRGDFRSPQVYVASLDDLTDGDGPNVMLAPGDVVYVTDHWIADVGEVLDRLAPLLSVGTAIGITYAVSR